MSAKVTWIARLAAVSIALAGTAARAQAPGTDFELERLQLNASGSGALTIWDGALELSALFRPEASLESYSGSTFDRALHTWSSAVMFHTGGTGARVEVNARYSRNFFAPGWGAELQAGVRLPFSARGPELFVEAGPGAGSLLGQPGFRVYAGLAFGGPQQPLAGPETIATAPAAPQPAPTSSP